MKPVPPHQLLSAYLDGELSVSEREEVERLLEGSPEARQELLELEHVGMLLRQLPREALPKSFAPKVLDACLNDTAVFETPTPPPLTATPRISPEPSQPKRRFRQPSKSWLGLTFLAASALGLIVFFSLPKPQDTDRDTIARQTPPTTGAETMGLPIKAAEDMLEMQLADDGTAERAQNDVRFQQGQGETAKTPGEEAQVPSAAISSADALLAPGGMDRKASAFSNKELKDLPAGQIALAIDHQGEQVAVVKLVVENREEGLKQLKQVLQKHQIAHEPNAESEQDALKQSDSEPKDDSDLLAVYVATSEDQLAFVMQDLQKEAAFQKLTMDTPLTAAQFDPYFLSPNAKPNAEAQNRRIRFGGMGGGAAPKAFRAPQTMKAEAAPKPDPEPPAPKKTPAETAESKTDRPEPAAPRDPGKNGFAPEDEPAALSNPSVAGFGNAGSKAIREGEKVLPEADRSANEAKPKSRDKAAVRPMTKPAEGPSVQRQLQLSPGDLESLQNQLAEPKAQEAPTDARGRLGSSETPASSKTVQVLFVLVDKAENAKTSPEATTPPAND